MFAEIDYDLFTINAVCAGVAPDILRPDVRLSSITTSSMEVRSGSLFVPLADKRDGHEFIGDAVSRGAGAFFLKKGHPIGKKLPQEIKAKAIEVADPLLALGKLAKFHRNRFTPLVIAVTGSNGKTTTKEMLAQIFHEAVGKACVATEKNYNNHIGLPFMLFAIAPGTRVAILEMGMNHAGEIAYLSRLAQPHIAVISSIGYAHIEFFKSRAGIAAAKAEILNGMENGTLYLPRNIQEKATLVRAARRHKIYLKSIAPKKHDFPYPNPAWVSNFSLAAAIARDAGIGEQHIATVARNFKPADGRMQLKKGLFTLIDDGYNANPDSAMASIESALQIGEKKPVVCIFGDFKEMGKFSRTLHAKTGAEAAKKGITAFYGVGKDMKSAVVAFRKAGKKNQRAYFFSREQTRELLSQVKQEAPDSLVLIKGSRSMQMEEIVNLLL